MRKPVLVLLAVVLAIGVVIAGCGGGSDNGSESEGSTLTKAEFLKKGNAICAKGNKEIGEAIEEFGKEHHFSRTKKPSPAELEEAAKQVLIPRIRKQIEGVRALGGPKGEEAEVESILAAAERALEEGEENPRLLVEEGEGPFTEANKLSRRYGLVKCGEEEGEEG